mgnify:CR=1 FL=1
MVKDWPLEQPSAVAETSVGPSRLIAGVSLGGGSPLMPEAIATQTVDVQASGL